MRVVWADEARAHLAGIHDFIKRDAPFYANQTIDRLTRRVEQLIDHPRSGRIVPKYDDESLRELIAHPYRNLIYRIKPNRIDISSVVYDWVTSAVVIALNLGLIQIYILSALDPLPALKYYVIA